MKQDQLTETDKQADIERIKHAAVFDVMEKYDEALIELDSLPDMLQMLIGYYKLDELDLTQNEILDIGIGYKEIYSILSAVQRRLWDIKDKVELIRENVEL